MIPPEPSYVVDFAASCDDEADNLAEQMGCSRSIALRVLAWERQRRAAEKQIVFDTLRRVIAELIQPGNPLVRVWALIFASGMTERIVDGPKSQAQKAEQLGVTRANMSHFVRRWKSIFPFPDTTFSRTEQAVQHSREARMRVLAAGASPHARNINGRH